MNKKSVVISSVMVSILVVGVIGTTYAYFKSNVSSGSSTPTSVKANTISGLTFNAGKNISLIATQTNMASGASDLSDTTEASVTLKSRNDASDNYNYKTCVNITENTFVHSVVSSTSTTYGMTKNIIDYKTLYSNDSRFTLDTSLNIVSGANNLFNGLKITIPSKYLNKTLTFSADLKKSGTINRVFVHVMVNGEGKEGSSITSEDEFVKSKVTFTPTSESDYIHIAYGSGSGTVYAKNIQLEEGSVATPYDQYGYITSPELVLSVTKNGTVVLTQDIASTSGEICVPTSSGGSTLTHNISASANATTTDTWKATITLKNLDGNQNVNTDKTFNANFVFTKI